MTTSRAGPGVEASAQPLSERRRRWAATFCTAVPSADSACPLLLYETDAVLRERAATRDIPLRDFFTGPGLTALEDGELLLGVRVTPCLARLGFGLPQDQPACGGGHRARERRPPGRVGGRRLHPPCAGPRRGGAHAAPGRRGRRTRAGADRSTRALLDELAELADAAARPITDVRASADYRRRMVECWCGTWWVEAWRRALVRGEGGRRSDEADGAAGQRGPSASSPPSPPRRCSSACASVWGSRAPRRAAATASAVPAWCSWTASHATPASRWSARSRGAT